MERGKQLRIVAQIMIFVLGAWALFAGVVALFGYTFYFPFRFTQSLEDIPLHRYQLVRVSVFLTFAYLTIRHFLFGTQKLYPVQFLDLYLKFLVGSGPLIYYQHGITEYREYAVLGFFLVAAILSHLLSIPDYRKIFFKR